MNRTVTRIAQALNEFAAELAHADTLVAEQQPRIEALGAEVARLQAALEGREAA